MKKIRTCMKHGEKIKVFDSHLTVKFFCLHEKNGHY